MDKVNVTIEWPVSRLAELQTLLQGKQTEAPVPVPEIPAVVAEPEPVKVTKTMIRARGLELTKTGEAGALEDIFKRFGAEKLSDLKEEDYEEAYKLMGGLL